MSSVAVTGLGVIAPNGTGLDRWWSATLAGTSGIGPISRFETTDFPVRLAGEIRDFPAAECLPSRLLPQTDRMTQFALAAADWAITDSGADLSAYAPLETGVITASSSGGFEFGQRELQHLWSNGPQHVSAYMSFAWFYAVNSGQIAIRHGLCGPTGVFVTEQAGGLDAIAHARRRLRSGSRLMLAGGIDSSLCPYGLAAQIRSGRLSGGTDVARSYLPFDRDASGYVPGEGGALLVLEPREQARLRGARVYAEIAGYGASFDPRPGPQRRSNLGRAVRAALRDAGVSACDIGVVIADATGVPRLDAEESTTLAEVFGPGQVPVTAPKTMTGRLYSGAAALDVVTAVMTLHTGTIPHTTNVSAVPAEYGIDLVLGTTRPLRAPAALVVARGFGGFNSAMVVTTAER